MAKSITIKEDSLRVIKESMVGSSNTASHNTVCVNEARPEVDEFELGQESDNPPVGGNYCHVNETYNASVRGDMDKVDYIDYVPHDNAREEGYTVDNITEFTPYYELICYGVDGDIIFSGELTLNELFDYFPDRIIHMMSNKEGRKVSQAEYRIEDILSWDCKPNNIDDVEEVNAIAKRIQPGGPSAYLLVDGDMVSFPDHIQITSIEGMSPSKFVGLGNIRVGVGGNGIELSKMPTQDQLYALKTILRGQNETYLDIVKDDGRMYPTCICSAAYKNANPNRVINDIIYYFEDGIRPQGTMAYESKRKYKSLIENIDFEVNSSDIDLSSFKKKNRLAPIWNEQGELNPKIRLKLLDIADDFWNFVNLKWVNPSGIILTGSICNFNWSHYSDIDLHLVVDFDEIDEKTEFVRDYLDAKKNEWNNEHEDLKILDYPVELYVQNLDEIPQSGGIYDLEENDWIKKPNADDIKSIGLNKFSIKDKAANIMTIIDDMYDALNSTSDLHDIEQIGDDAKYLWKKVKDMRKKSLETSGENGSGNIVYKILRRTNYLEKLWKLSTIVYDRSNSITESTNVENIDIFSLAKERFGTTNDIRECGYVLPDGSMLDFSGRHMVTGDTDTSHLKGRRSVDHREIGDLNWDRDMTTRNNLNINMADFIRKGAIRIHCSNTWSSINLFVKPTKEQINPLLRLIQYSKGNVTVEVGDGDNSYEYAEWDEANPRRVINDVIRYFDGVTIKLVGNVTESKEIIKEYLEKDNNLPLYKYFKWVQTASENDKLKDLMYDAPYALEQYIKNMSKQYPQFEELRMELIKNEDIVYDEDFVEKASEIVVSLGLYNAYECFFRNVIDYYEWPSWLEMDFIRIVKNEWCIHFTEYADDISREGFTGGTPDISRLAFTGAGQQKREKGYDFAFLLNDKNVDFNNYGTKAVIFRTSGVLVRHYGDEQDQVIFWGPNVKSFIPVENDGDWIVYGQKGQVLFRGEKPSDVAFWATNNLPQYRKQIMTGKNGYIPKQAIYDPKTYKVTHKPYPIYRNESIQRCLTLLKEETVADGSSTSNPYKKRWKAEREALKNFVANYGKLMQSKEDDKGGKLYKVFFDKTMSNLIGYNYCICVQWDEVQMKPKSTVYIRALDKFTPFIRRNVQYDQRGQDNQRGTYDDLQYGNQGQNNYQYQ